MTYRLKQGATLVAAFLLILLGSFVAAGGVAHANEFPALDTATSPSASSLIWGSCDHLKAFYVNPDENSPDDPDGDRLPTATPDGLTFEGAQLIHHASGELDTDNLVHGTYAANPAPDQPSFFSVEVRNADGTGYATLRWNTVTNKWDMTVSGVTYSDENPSKLVDLKGKSHHVFSFGVGYTAKPKGTVKVLVTSISFHGTTYRLDCHLGKPTGSPTHTRPTHKPSGPVTTKPTSPATTAPTTRPTSSPSANPTLVGNVGGGSTGGALAITGPSTPYYVAGGLLILLSGAAIVWVFRRRKVDLSA